MTTEGNESGVDRPDDASLVTRCLEGSSGAWEDLVDRYERLVWAIILRRGIPTDHAADVFQNVWVDVFNDLKQVRNRESVRPWLSSIVLHKCSRWYRSQHKHDAVGTEMPDVGGGPDWSEELLRRDAMLRCVNQLSPRCQELVRMLFFTDPPLPYKDVAERLGLALGSVGFIRGRCLEKLREALERDGLW